MSVTVRHERELAYLAKRGLLWAGVPPEKADGDLSLYIERGWVEWHPGRGYLITDAGRRVYGSKHCAYCGQPLPLPQNR